MVGIPRLPENQVLAVEAGSDEWQSRQCGTTDHKSPECIRQVFPQAAHSENVVFIVQGLDHDARHEEQQGFEERMRHEMENRRCPCAYTEREEHVADLADG